MSFSQLPYNEFVGLVSRYMTYQCGCNCARADGHLPCLGGCSGRYIDAAELAPPAKKAFRPKKQTKYQEKVVPPSPYQRRDALLSKWYDEYVRDQHFDTGKSYLWVHKDCQRCQDFARERAFRPALEAMQIKFREDYDLLMLRKEKEEREKKARQTELELLRAEKRAEKRARDEVEELEYASDEDVVYDWAEEDQ